MRSDRSHSRPGAAAVRGLVEVGEVPQGVHVGNTLILMGCSGTKRKVETPIALADLYDGPLWRTLRTHLGDSSKLRRLSAEDGARVLVLSGGFGLVDALNLALPYEARLTSAAAQNLIERGVAARSDFPEALRQGLVLRTPVDLMSPRRGADPWSAALVCGGDDYRRVLLTFLDELAALGGIAPAATALVTRGTIGVQRSQLGRWLRALRCNAGLEGR